jgi:hypothetical protein
MYFVSLLKKIFISFISIYLGEYFEAASIFMIVYLSLNILIYLRLLPYWVRIFNIIKFYLEFLSLLVIGFLIKNEKIF